ncbi:hypothetical protein RRV45_02295 [Bacillus sp. DTU_2020_1000418_1_SI_GHA_SEK_038]|uniref:hypothetical protein n=1 Tax=Bacillus sp. DTU_2020_1000418_1_SI_GHA_SEK_038 TaxID=3077585 RepID=UPI0028F04EC8|nr:hypothetical protein [Bacillus sp. DTU_2020_1000418_1_SI_GHA_SEK_038]WNS75885.1 hypothetical protein RRV45_02295 [Bacillus sp. DTU_2020_1000418_1_SI_GHA_SEK_038]
MDNWLDKVINRQINRQMERLVHIVKGDENEVIMRCEKNAVFLKEDQVGRLEV